MTSPEGLTGDTALGKHLVATRKTKEHEHTIPEALLAHYSFDGNCAVCHDAIRTDRPPIRYGDWICPKYSPTIAWPYVVSIPAAAKCVPPTVDSTMASRLHGYSACMSAENSDVRPGTVAKPGVLVQCEVAWAVLNFEFTWQFQPAPPWFPLLQSTQGWGYP